MSAVVPARMKRLDRDRRGYPVPVIVVRDASGAPHFAVNDIETMAAIAKEDRCSICGMKLNRGRWLIGGPLSAFAERGKFADGPLHHECATYALGVCPYLAAPSYGGLDKAKALARAGGGLGFDIAKTDPARPVVFVALMSVAVETERKDIATWLYRPRHGSIRRIDLWRHGAVVGGAGREDFKVHARAMLTRYGEPARTDLAWWWRS